MEQNPPFPSPEELKSKLSEFMKTNFGDKVSFATFAQPETAEGEGEEKPAESDEEDFAFNFLPRDIKAHLDRFVIQQDEAKKVLAIAVCDHYNHVNYLRRLEKERSRAELTEYAKQNVILVGPTGVGKTYLIKHIAELIDVPFVKADATKFSETGYVGGDVEDLVRELVQKADGDVARAQFGIIYIDEIDKIAAASNVSGRDVSGRGVQTTLLKLMEETDVPLRSANDLQSQLQAAFEFQKRGNKAKKETISTGHILFVVSGAFERLKQQVSRRIAQGNIGFNAEPRQVMDSELFQHVTTQDFIEYGFEPEFIGRLPVRVVCEELTADDLYQIMKFSEGSILRQYERAFRAYGIEVSFEDEALHLMATEAAKEKTGARGLLTVWEKLFRDYKYHLAGSGLTQLRVSSELVREPKRVLERLMAEGHQHEEASLRQGARIFAEQFEKEHGIKISFDDAALQRLAERTSAERMTMPELCAHLFKDYQFGLSLIRKNTNQGSFVLGREAVDAPDKFLSELVVRSHYPLAPAEKA